MKWLDTFQTVYGNPWSFNSHTVKNWFISSRTFSTGWKPILSVDHLQHIPGQVWCTLVPKFYLKIFLIIQILSSIFYVAAAVTLSTRVRYCLFLKVVNVTGHLHNLNFKFWVTTHLLNFYYLLKSYSKIYLWCSF